MGKIKRAKVNSIASLKTVDVSEQYAAVDTSATDFIYDEVDQYYAEEDRRGLEKVSKLIKKPKATYRDDVLGVASSSEDEEVVKKKPKKKKKAAYEDAEPLPALDSDLEDGQENEEEEDISSKWGKKRSLYYDADYVDEDWDDGDADDAELEEKEALAIQQRLTQQLDEADFGLDFITHLKESETVKNLKIGEEKIEVNLDQLTKQGKLDLLNKESPELLELIDDFKLQMSELKDNLHPLLNLISAGTLPSSPGVNFIKTKYNIIINYCTYISFYFMLKAKRISVQNHPVIKRLVQFRSLLHQLETGASKFQSEIDRLLVRIRNGDTLTAGEFVKAPPRKKLRILTKSTEEEPQVIPEKPKKKETTRKTETLTTDEQEALEFYSALNQHKNKEAEEDSEDEDEDENEGKPEGGDEHKTPEEEGTVGKRAINYQIAKNKGLTPHRSKEQRNPRVKHRMKFRKAKIRRKGQIREPRKELKRYDGEISGIKASVVRSVKIK